jgi:hypothetical protein
MRLRLALTGLAVGCLLTAAAHRRAVAPPPSGLETGRSFVVTDEAIDGFTFERVMTTLVARSGVPDVTPLSLYQQWFDTQNPKPGLAAMNGPHCDDFLTDGKPSFNGFERRCPTPEGALAAVNPFLTADFVPIALVNRFDMVPADGSNCGNYRIVFKRRARFENEALNVIFEAVLPNPHPEEGLAACRPVAQFWAGLSYVDSVYHRQARLEEFFFNGIPGFSPVIHPDHYSGSGGAIRTVQDLALQPRFYQFELRRSCSAGACTLVMEPVVLDNVALGDLLNGANTSDQARRFRDVFVGQVKNLAIPDPNLFFMNIPAEFSVAESDPTHSLRTSTFYVAFGFGLLTFEGREFRTRIEEELRSINSKETAEGIVFRAHQRTCYGCHTMTWPPAHVRDTRFEHGIGTAEPLSRVLREVFVPHRMDVLRKYLAGQPLPGHQNLGGTIGGARVVH